MLFTLTAFITTEGRSYEYIGGPIEFSEGPMAAMGSSNDPNSDL